MNYGKEFYASYPETYMGDLLSGEIIRQVGTHIRGNVLEIGAGTGKMLNAMSNLKNVCSCTGIDICPKSDKVREASAENIPCVDNIFETVIMLATLEHMDDITISKSLDEIYRVMAEGGKLIITVPYQEDFNTNRVCCPECSAVFHRYGHVQNFTENSILVLLWEHNFRVTTMYHAEIGFMSAHPYLRPLMPIIRMFGFFKGNELIVCIAQKDKSWGLKITKTTNSIIFVVICFLLIIYMYLWIPILYS